MIVNVLILQECANWENKEIGFKEELGDLRFGFEESTRNKEENGDKY